MEMESHFYTFPVLLENLPFFLDLLNFLELFSVADW